MIEFNKVPETGDPSPSQQLFEKLKINVLCCRYWWLDEWKSQEMTFPYWRLYWNRNKGAYVFYKHEIELSPDKIILIPPFTPFSTYIHTSEKNMQSPYTLKGGWIKSSDEETELLNKGSILHFFVHFNLGFPYDNYPAGLYDFDINPALQHNLNNLLQLLTRGESNFNISGSLHIYNLIISLVSQLEAENWQKKIIDPRIREIVDFITRNPGIQEENATFASKVRMATNSFARLFKENMGTTPHIYLNQVRIDKACDLLHHTNLSIEKIADQCGFFDRYHLSKAFKKAMNVSPAEYRKSFFIPEN